MKKIIFGLCFLPLNMIGMLFAEDVTTPPPFEILNEPVAETRNFFGEFMYMLFVLGIMITFLFLASWALKRLMSSRYQNSSGRGDINILETRPLSHKSVLHLVEIDGERILIGESPTQLTHVATLGRKSSQ